MEQYRRVLQRLAPCVADHRQDLDWVTNQHKQVCEERGCTKALCERCAGKRVLSGPAGVYSTLWCREHAKE